MGLSTSLKTLGTNCSTMEALEYWNLFISGNGLSHERVKQKKNRRKLGLIKTSNIDGS